MTRDPGFRDHFSGAAAAYARFRPRYPDALFAWLAAHAPSLDRAWDCGTGSGQAAVALAAHVRLVVASDASVKQLAAAQPHPRVRYLACTAERAPLATDSVGLVTVAQALHWFDTAAFFAEARRVCVPGGLVAVWTYGDVILPDGPLREAMRETQARVRPYWPSERALVDDAYRSVPFPFEELTPPPLTLEQRWTLDDVVGYVGTWSAAMRHHAATGDDARMRLRETLGAAWGDPATRHPVRWELAVRAGVVR